MDREENFKARDLWCPWKLVHWESERYENVVNNNKERERERKRIIAYKHTSHLLNIVARILYVV